MFKKLREVDIAFYCCMMGIAIFAGALLQVVVLFPIVLIFGDLALDPTISTLISLYTTIFASIIIFYIALKKDGFTFESLGLTKKNALKRYVLGLIIGFVTFSISLLITYVFGGARYIGFVMNEPLLLLLFFIGFMFQGFEEELMCRGFMMRGLSRKRSLFFSVWFNSFYFALLHIGNPGITLLSMINLFLVGIVYSCIAVYFDDLWVVSGAHSMWNFAQGNFYGILVSGMSMGPTVFQFELSGNPIISGGDFGLEGGLGVLIVEILSLIVFYYLYKKRMNKNSVSI